MIEVWPINLSYRISNNYIYRKVYRKYPYILLKKGCISMLCGIECKFNNIHSCKRIDSPRTELQNRQKSK